MFAVMLAAVTCDLHVSWSVTAEILKFVQPVIDLFWYFKFWETLASIHAGTCHSVFNVDKLLACQSRLNFLSGRCSSYFLFLFWTETFLVQMLSWDSPRNILQGFWKLWLVFCFLISGSIVHAPHQIIHKAGPGLHRTFGLEKMTKTVYQHPILSVETVRLTAFGTDCN